MLSRIPEPRSAAEAYVTKSGGTYLMAFLIGVEARVRAVRERQGEGEAKPIGKFLSTFTRKVRVQLESEK
jgi:hypothetical protein